MGATALVAILFTDLVGSTEAASRLGEDGADSLCFLARACGVLGDAVIAAELYDALQPYRLLVNGLTIWCGPPTHELGVLAATLSRYDDAEVHFIDAVERQDRIGARGTLVHTRLAWAEMLGRRNGPGDAERARTLLQDAKAGARELALPHLEARADTMLASVG